MIRVLRDVAYHEGDKRASIQPSEHFQLNFDIDFDHPLFDAHNQSMQFSFSQTSFIKSISRARTFGFSKDLDYLRAQNLAKGGSLKNAVVMDETRVLNEDGLRYENECVRHKILDAVGDLYLLGHPVVGAFTGYKSGHAMNFGLTSALLNDAHAFEVVAANAPMH